MNIIFLSGLQGARVYYRPNTRCISCITATNPDFQKLMNSRNLISLPAEFPAADEVTFEFWINHMKEFDSKQASIHGVELGN